MLPNLAHWLTSSLLVVAIALILVASQARGGGLLINDIKYAARHLPTNVQPLEYDLQLTLLEGINAVNEGTVEIFVEFKHRKSTSLGSRLIDKVSKDKADNLEPRDRIVLNVGNNIKAITRLEISVGDSIEQIRKGQGQSLAIKGIGRDRNAEVLVVRSRNSLPEGSIGLISISYSWGRQESYDPKQRLDDESYRVIRVQPGEAREMLPCFDEPHLKANVVLTVRHPDSSKNVAWHTSVANSYSVVNQDYLYTMKNNKLLRTPVPVPLHSIAFVIGPFKVNGGTQLERDVSNQRQIHLMAPFDKLNKGRFAIDFAVEAAKWFETHLKQPMPMGLMLISIPESESSLAGWDVAGGLGIGLINENFLLVDSNSGVDDKTECLLNVALAVARQWFGGMLTPAAVEDFWITEGLAAYMAQRVVGQLRPEFQVDQYVAANRIPPDELFSGSYEDAAKRLVTTDRLRLFRGAQIIDRLRRDQTASEEDFEAIVRRLFEEPNGLDLAGLADAFANEQVSSKNLVSSMQKRILSGHHIWIQVGIKDNQLVVKQLAKVPLPVALQIRLVFAEGSGTLVSNMELHDFAQGKTEIKFKIPNHLSLKWAVAAGNDLQTLPYYRVRYSDELLERFAGAFEISYTNEHALKQHDRLAIISDALDEAKTFANEKGSQEKLFKTIELYEQEEDFEVLLVVMRAIETYHKLFDKNQLFPSLADHLERLLFGPLGGLSGSRREAPIKQRVKLAILNFLSRIANERAIDEALALFDQTSLGSAELMGYLADSVHEIVKRFGSHTQRNRLYYRLSYSADTKSAQQLWKQLGLE